MVLQGGSTSRRHQNLPQDLAVLRFGRSAMFRRPLSQACHELLIQITHDQLSHAINDGTRHHLAYGFAALGHSEVATIPVRCCRPKAKSREPIYDRPNSLPSDGPEPEFPAPKLLEPEPELPVEPELPLAPPPKFPPVVELA